ncbi:MAG: zinc metalloprotease HtpX [Deltaproteobacteria bacterium]|nr:zinc metalloprotease HtpX [Deltaproteobacteria bacterium]
MNNTLKTTLLLASLTCLLIAIGGIVGGQNGMILFFVISLLMNLFSYWYSDKIVLKLYKATPIDPSEKTYEVVQKLAHIKNLPMPKVYRIPSRALNAFATGRNPQNAAVAVTQGIEEALSEEELEGVLAHELGHVENRDILVSTIAASLAGAIMMIANIAKWSAIFGVGGGDRDRPHPFALILTAIIAPLAAMLIQLAVSRSREFLADEASAKTTHNPYALANALRKISREATLPASPQTAHLFISNPLKGKGVIHLFSTHPSTEERIKRLENMRF